MSTNLRKGFGRCHYWTGIEVERTQFYGEETIFCVTPLIAELERLKSLMDLPRFPHVYIGFHKNFMIAQSVLNRVQAIVLWLLKTKHKKVTVELIPEYAILPIWTLLRHRYPDLFCLLIRVEVPSLMVGGFALKAIPSVAFGDKEDEAGVMTASFPMLQDGLTLWKSYEGDKDGE